MLQLSEKFIFPKNQNSDPPFFCVDIYEAYKLWIGLLVRLNVELDPFSYSGLFTIGEVPGRGKGGKAHLALWDNEIPMNHSGVD